MTLFQVLCAQSVWSCTEGELITVGTTGSFVLRGEMGPEVQILEARATNLWSPEVQIYSPRGTNLWTKSENWRWLWSSALCTGTVVLTRMSGVCHPHPGPSLPSLTTTHGRAGGWCTGTRCIPGVMTTTPGGCPRGLCRCMARHQHITMKSSGPTLLTCQSLPP